MKLFKRLLASAFLATGMSIANGAVIEVRLADADRTFDYEAVSDGTAASQGVGNDLRIGTTVASTTTPRLASAILPFALPEIPAGEQITSATLSLFVVGQAVANQPTSAMNVDLYGLPVDAAPFDITNTRYFSGENDATLGVSKLQTDFLTSTTPGVTETSTTTYTLRTSVDISSYLIALYEGGAVAGDFAVLRLSMDNPDPTLLQRYRIRSSGGTGAANPEAEKPVLTITTVPEPGAVSLMAAASLGLIARRRRKL